MYKSTYLYYNIDWYILSANLWCSFSNIYKYFHKFVIWKSQKFFHHIIFLCREIESNIERLMQSTAKKRGRIYLFSWLKFQTTTFTCAYRTQNRENLFLYFFFSSYSWHLNLIQQKIINIFWVQIRHARQIYTRRP